MQESIYWITNVLLESGYHYEENIAIGTKTEKVHILINQGIITDIVLADTPLDNFLPQKDGNNLLILPSFLEKHCHLDKTLIGDSWRACRQVSNRIERCNFEKNLLPTLATSTKERAEALLQVLLNAGSTHVRTHVDIYPEAGLSYLEAVQQALATYDGKLSHEIVAFPQHGLLRTNSKDLVRAALREGANLVGGVDPAVIDGDIEASLQQMMDIAVEADVGIDLHLHDPSHLGIFTMRRLAALTEEAGWQGRVTISHAYGLGEVSLAEAEEEADMLVASNISIITSVPIHGPMPPIDLLTRKGVPVAIGCDNIFDSWSPFGNGDIIERASCMAERYNWIDEQSLAQTLGFITNGKTPLDRKGKQVWPKIGDEASMVFVEASCSAELIARRSRRRAVMYKGKVVAGKLNS
ncbi:amidohydrolase [Lysinibacillus sp. ZYM-1]|uniref:amidohydrolase n=1 Tax=Lysinibacillus sp. ZYM-1 TaxID=1681184 RepID=UPI0006CE8FD5|nr:amidohydrolase [Lysinibacillus sp. ZYM-1]KPN93147.1 deaminase [Lysinibacillus sp. ZYM-1]